MQHHHQDHRDPRSAVHERRWVGAKPPPAGGGCRQAKNRGRWLMGRNPAGVSLAERRSDIGLAVVLHGVSDHAYGLPGDKLWKQQAKKEILKRALAPPRRLSWRWKTFRPTPSRLSNMSMA